MRSKHGFPHACKSLIMIAIYSKKAQMLLTRPAVNNEAGRQKTG